MSPSTFPDLGIVLDPGLAPYWAAAAENRLVLSRCAEDGLALWPPRPFCPEHARAGVTWEQASGRALVHSFTVVHRGEGAFAGVAPYVLAYVELEEGPLVMGNIVDAAGAPVSGAEIGQPVVARFDLAVGDVPILRFAVVDGDD